MLRFKKFKDEWSEISIDNIVTRITRKNTKLESTIPLTISAEFGLVDQTTYFNKKVSATDLSAYYLIKKGEFAYNKSYSKNYPWGAIKRLDNYEKGVLSTLYICFSINKNTIPDFIKHYFESDKWYKQISLIAVEGARNHGLLNISVNDFFKILVRIPSVEEQSKISLFFEAIDSNIKLQQEKIELLREQKKGYMQKIFSHELRFKSEDIEDYPAWKKVKLARLTKRTGKKNSKGIKYPVAAISNKKGFTFEADRNYSNTNVDLKTYKLVHKNEFAYNPARINVGSFGFQNVTDTAIVSSLYVVFETLPELLNSFLKAYMHSRYFNQDVIRNTEGSVREYLFYENFANIEIPLPCLEEQEKIAQFLMKLDSKILKEEQVLEGLNIQKKAFMQQMFL